MSRRPRAPQETEAGWQKVVTDLAEVYRWDWAHFRPARTVHGWATPVSGTIGKGFPDLVLVRAGRVIFAELKVGTRPQTPEQMHVEQRLRAAGAEFYLWRPGDYEEVLRVLSERGAT